MSIPKEFSFKISPFKQGIIVFILMVSLFILLYVLRLLHVIGKDPMDIWLISSSTLLFFILFNSVVNFQYQEIMTYYRESIYTFIGLLSLIILISTLLSGVQVFDAESYYWILYVFSLVYLVFISITSLMRKIVAIALKQEEDEEKRTKKY